MPRIYRTLRALAAGCAACALPFAPAARAQTTAVEYFHAVWGHYFVTVSPEEQSVLDNGTLAGWTRTGESFAVDGSADVCRFFTARFAGKGSHFYTPYASECDGLRAGAVWTYEGLVFRLGLPGAGGACPAGTRALYRLYNEGQSGAPNHRYTVRSDIVTTMRSRGWTSEGVGLDPVFACVPAAAGSAGPNGTWWLDRIGACNSAPAGCSTACADASLQAVLAEAADGRTLALSFPGGGHPAQTLAQVLGSPYHQAFGNCEPGPGASVPGGSECASAALDLPDRTTGIFQITRTFTGSGGSASCAVWSSYLGAKL